MENKTSTELENILEDLNQSIEVAYEDLRDYINMGRDGDGIREQLNEMISRRRAVLNILERRRLMQDVYDTEDYLNMPGA